MQSSPGLHSALEPQLTWIGAQEPSWQRSPPAQSASMVQPPVQLPARQRSPAAHSLSALQRVGVHLLSRHTSEGAHSAVCWQVLGRVPSVQMPLRVDENVRGISFYAPAVK